MGKIGGFKEYSRVDESNLEVTPKQTMETYCGFRRILTKPIYSSEIGGGINDKLKITDVEKKEIRDGLTAIFKSKDEENYKMVTYKELSELFLTLWEKVNVFVWDAGKIILAVSILLWSLASFGPTELNQKNIDKINQSYSSGKLTGIPAGSVGSLDVATIS